MWCRKRYAYASFFFFLRADRKYRRLLRVRKTSQCAFYFPADWYVLFVFCRLPEKSPVWLVSASRLVRHTSCACFVVYPLEHGIQAVTIVTHSSSDEDLPLLLCWLRLPFFTLFMRLTCGDPKKDTRYELVCKCGLIINRVQQRPAL